MTANEILKKIKEECASFSVCSIGCPFYNKELNKCTIYDVIGKYPYQIEIESSENIEEITDKRMRCKLL